MTAVNHKTRASAFGTLATYAGALPIEGAGEAPGAAVSQISWIGKSGNWDTTADWSGGALPNAQDQVTINTTAAATVTYSTGSSAIQSLTTGGEDTLEVTGGTLVVGGGGAYIGGTLDLTGGTLAVDGTTDVSFTSELSVSIINQSGGVLDLGGQGLTLYYGDTLDQTGGTIDVVSGSLDFAGQSDVIDGAVTGTDLNLSGGNGTLGSAADITTTSFEMGGTWAVLGNLSYAGAFSGGGTLLLGSNTLSLAGESTLGGLLTGTGYVTVGGTAEGDFNLGNLETLSNTGTFLQTGLVGLGVASTDSCSVTNTAGADWILASGSALGGYYSANGSFTNAGMMECQFSPFARGTDTINVGTFTSTGSLLIDAGAVAVIDSQSCTLSGTVTGNGTLSLEGATTLAPGLALDTAGLVLTDITLGSALTYKGTFDCGSGSIALGGNTLTLDGATTFGEADQFFNATVDFGGKGALDLAGDTQIGDSSYLSSSAPVTNTGTLGGDGSIEAPFINSKLLSISLGDQLDLVGNSASLGGTVSGAGTLELDTSAGSTLAAGLRLSVAALICDDATTLAGNVAYAGNLSLGSTLALAGHTLSASGNVSLGGTISGSGSIKSSGDALVAGNLDVINNAVLTNSQTMTIAGGNYGDEGVTIGSGSIDRAELVNASTGVMNLTGSQQYSDTAEIYGGGSHDIFSNAGLVTVSAPGGGSASFGIVVSNIGTILAGQRSEISFGSSVTGSGMIVAGTGASLNFAGSASGGTIALGTNSSLTVETSYGKSVLFGDVITGFSLGDIIEIQGMEYNPNATLSFNSTAGLLTITSNAGSYSTSETFHLAGSYSSSSFNLFEENGYMAISHS